MAQYIVTFCWDNKANYSSKHFRRNKQQISLPSEHDVVKLHTLAVSWIKMSHKCDCDCDFCIICMSLWLQNCFLQKRNKHSVNWETNWSGTLHLLHIYHLKTDMIHFRPYKWSNGVSLLAVIKTFISWSRKGCHFLNCILLKWVRYIYLAQKRVPCDSLSCPKVTLI